LHEADRGAANRAARDPVADACDLALVGHQAREPGARARLDLLRHPPCAGRIMHRRPPRPDPGQAAAHRPPAEVDVEADGDLRWAGTDRALDQVEVGSVVDHQHRRAGGVLGREPPDLGDRAAIDGRIGDEQVGEPGAGEVKRLRGGEREHAANARVEVEDPPQDGDRAHRLRRHPDR